MNRSRMLFICSLEMIILISSPMILASANGRILWASAHARIEIEKNEEWLEITSDPQVSKFRVEIVEDGYRDGKKVYSPAVRFVPVDEDDTDIGLETEEDKDYPEDDKEDPEEDREGRNINEQREK